MAQYWAPQITSDFHSPFEYCSLQQQRRRLLEELANEEARREHIANILEVKKVQLSAAQNSGKSIRALKKSSLYLHRKLISSENTEKSLSQALAMVTARLNFLEQTQWRRAILEYNEPIPYGQSDGLAARMQNMALTSPITPGFPVAHNTSGFVSPMSPLFIHPWTPGVPTPSGPYQLFSPTNTLHPSSSFPYEQQGSWVPELNTFRSAEAMDSSKAATLESDSKRSSLRFPVQDFVPAQRALSLPDISTSPHLSLDKTSSEKHLGGNECSLARKLSLVNQPSSALRMQRKYP